MDKTIIIIGGGISGLALAQGLSKNGIKFKVFERDEGKSFREQGYRVRISPEGSRVLKEMLTEDLWNLFKDSCGRTTFGMSSINAIDGKIIKRGPNFSPVGKLPDESMVFSVDRTNLRNLLTLNIENHIEFDKKFTKYQLIKDEITGEDKIKAHFSDGTSFIGDFIVGADGVNSKVKKQLIPDCKTFDTNGRLIFGKTEITNQLLDTLPASAMEWITTVNDPEKSLILFMEPIKFKPIISKVPEGLTFNAVATDYLHWVLLGQAYAFEKSDNELFKMTPSQLKEHQLHLIRNWDPRFQEIIKSSYDNKSCYLGITSSFPDIFQWETNEHVTLMGDSIHNMPPTGGAGANTALVDCLILLEAIKNGLKKEDLNQYEAKMRSNAKLNIEISLKGAKNLYNFKSIEECKVISQ
ncbi:hypothetical protein RB653_000333 [Dictyostelium firmibasis]|uniref:FAD-binding domain-containing protein n=1 Tax=Dictyostelium firmibasis TaxID=79012 RepID=A0AAN7U244_9MYCE